MRSTHDTNDMITVGNGNRLNALAWLMYSADKKRIAEEESARIDSRFPEDVEVLCGVIGTIKDISPSQVFIAGISYNNVNNRITEFDKIRGLKRRVIMDGNRSAQKYMILDKHRDSLFEGRTKAFRVERRLSDKVFGISGATGIYATDIYLMSWWSWLFDYIEEDPMMNVLENNEYIKRALYKIHCIKEDMNEEILLWERYLE